jgi:hypothetical protein
MIALRIAGVAIAVTLAVVAQTPPVDTSRIGPQVGTAVPSVSGVDQFGRPQSLGSIYGPKGAMIVFFRSADW